MPENVNMFQSLFRNFWALLTIIVLIICSIISIYYMVERFLRYKQAKVNTNLLLNKLKKFLRKNGKFEKAGLNQALDVCKEIGGPVAVTLRAGLVKYPASKEELEESMQRTALEELAKLEQHLVIIGSIGSVAPFIGLLGTVIGVTEAFSSLSSMGGGGIAAVGGGIAQALIATIVGLFVAIPAVLGYNFLVSKVKVFEVEITICSSELINIIMGRDIEREKWDELLKEIKE